MNRTLGQTELSRLTGMSKMTIANWVKRGLPHDEVAIGTKVVRRFNLTEVNEWAKAQREKV